MNSKESLRVYLKKQLEGLSEEEQVAKSKLISGYLLKNLNQFKPHELGVYAPMLHEVLWHLEFDQNAVYLFSYFDEQGMMGFYPSNFSALEKCDVWKRNCLMPKKAGLAQIPKVMLIPGLGFAASGERLGRGKGYFDRYLENFKGLKIGICFKVQLVDDLPSLPHDVKMDWIVTEEGITECMKKF